MIKKRTVLRPKRKVERPRNRQHQQTARLMNKRSCWLTSVLS
jgi:hypothetical protein